jgi:hypothetical protein
MHARTSLSALCCAALVSLCGTAHAITDPQGDFLPGYGGSHNGDLDVLSSTVTYDAGTNLFDFTATLAAPVGTTSTAFYVWGLDRGQGTERFNTGPAPIGAGVKFDSVVTFRLDGSATVTTLVPTAVATSLPGDVTFAGNVITGSISGALLPSLGLLASNYTWNLWPRDGAVTGNAAISDFAPDASNAAVTAVPEPSTLALFGAGLGVLMLRRRVRCLPS